MNILRKLTFVDFVKHGVEDEQRLDGHGSQGISLGGEERPVVAREVVECRRVGAAVDVVGRGSGEDDGCVLLSEGLQQL